MLPHNSHLLVIFLTEYTDLYFNNLSNGCFKFSCKGCNFS